MSNITESTDQLETNAVAIAKGYFTASCEGIDTAFGKGFAKDHPELIAAYMRTAAIDLQTLVIARAIEYAADRIAESLRH
ncbi:MAG: hypothetical protein WB586_18960 [Chthoniobacterales bacterium]